MTVAKIDIWNMALASVGVSASILSETENTLEARQCRLFYAQCRDELFEIRPWSFVQRRASLQLLQGTSSDWGFRYAYPNFCARINAVVGKLSSVPQAFAVENSEDSYGRVILTDVQDAEISYNHRIEDESIFSPSFRRALILSLAASIAIPLRVDTGFQQSAQSAWLAWLQESGSSDMAQQKEKTQKDESGLISARW